METPEFKAWLEWFKITCPEDYSMFTDEWIYNELYLMTPKT